MIVTTASIVKFIVIALSLLFVIFVIWKLYRDNINEEALNTWPPVVAKCPDYWTYKDDGLCHHNNDTMSPLTEDSTEDDLIAKCAEIKEAGIPWEGIDNLC